MQNKLKSDFSILAIILFIIIGGVTFPEKSTNTTVDASGCMDKPPVSGTVQVVVNHKDKSGAAIPFATGRLYITEQNIYDTQTCTFSVVHDQFNFTTNVNGRFVYSKPFSHDNSKDLIRFQVSLDKTDIFNSYNAVKVAYYSTTNVTFNAISAKLEGL